MTRHRSFFTKRPLTPATALTGFNRAETDLVPGEIVAYRVFRVRTRGLYSLSVAHVWANGSVHEADCKKLGLTVPVVIPWNASRGLPSREQMMKFFEDLVENHHVPEPECTCGFYAYYSPDVARHYISEFEGLNRDPDDTGYEYVLAAVACSGRIILGTRGVRAAKMRILGVSIQTVTDESRREGVQDLLRQVPVTHTDAALLKQFPPPDPRTLVPDADVRTCAAEGANLFAVLVILLAAAGVFGALHFVGQIAEAVLGGWKWLVTLPYAIISGFFMVRYGSTVVQTVVKRRYKRRAMRDFERKYLQPN